MAPIQPEDTNWQVEKHGSPHPRDWSWDWQGGVAWPLTFGARPDPALDSWARAMHEWGNLVAVKCRDLEARVSFLEDQALGPRQKGA
jgi:hypothetical protein